MNVIAAAEAAPADGAPDPPDRRSHAQELAARTAFRVGLVSTLMLVPCFWQSRIQAGDLSSHLYNAWLSILIGEGKAPGLFIAPQRTNVLFDLMLSGLMRVVGPWGAEHIAVPLVVLVFFWGGFAMICAVSRRRPWYILTLLAMLSYGWVFHVGFMNFYLATGLCFWAFALLWKPQWPSALCAVPLIILACLAHALPVAWLGGSIAYAWIARKVRPRARPILVVSALAALLITRQVLVVHFATRWSSEQVVSMTGLDQMSVFGSKYLLLEFILLAIWLALFWSAVRRRGKLRMVFGIPLHLCIIASAAVFLLPTAILLPGYNHPLRYVSERMSLLVAVGGCAMLGEIVPGKREKTALAVLMGLFFSFLYMDTRALNHVERLMEHSVAQMPAGARVISALCDQHRDINLVGHALDRVCIGRCFSYGNYEPATGQFRVRARGPNAFVVSEDRDAGALGEGSYVVRPGDPPLYQIYLDGRFLHSRLLKTGDITGSTCFESTPSLRGR